MAAPGDLDDPNIRYIGRWDFSDPAKFTSYWCGDYIKAGFTGTTIKLRVQGWNGMPTNFHVKIDNGPWTTYSNVSGTVDVTPTPLAGGSHTISVAQGRDYDYEFNFLGFELAPGSVTTAPVMAPDLIEFIGDSITAGYTNSQAAVSDYAWMCAENLGCEHTQIAYPGIWLVSTATKGMEASYLDLRTVNYPDSPGWDFSRYTPRVVVINLGTNDNVNVPEATFLSHYTAFLENIRAKFPNAEIFAMRTFIGLHAAPTQAAVNARNAAGDSRVHYIDTEGWLTPNSPDFNDGLHPSDAGHQKVAAFLEPILAPYVAGATIPDGTYRILNRGSGLGMDAFGQGTGNGTPIKQWPYGGGANQRWTVTYLGSGRYRIIGVQSARSLDVTGESLADGAAIELWDYHAGDHQQWVLTPVSGGYYTIQSVRSGRFVEVEGQSVAAGASIIQWQGNGGQNQQWSFLEP